MQPQQPRVFTINPIGDGPPLRLTAGQAIVLQRELAGRVQIIPLIKPVRLVAGADVAFSPDGKTCFAAVIVLNYPRLELVEEATAVQPLDFPYIPGLLSFREAPTIAAAFQKLQNRPDVLLVDGQGLAHPRRFGVACHLGVILDLPTIGCAKSRLIGTHREPGIRKGCQARLLDACEQIGSVLRTRDNTRCLYVSVGHRVTLADALRVTLRGCRGCRLPEPARLAHHRVTMLRCTLRCTNPIDKATGGR